MNDPNGLVFFEGRLHVFFQYNPDAPRWGRMRWGHAASRDLVTWEQLPIALEPGARGPDRTGCWSGTLVVDDAGVPTIFYAGVAPARGVLRASICRATSRDGLRTWTKDPAGPVIGGPPAGIRADRFRDPFVWREDEGWAMLLGAGTVGGHGTVLLYRSDDLRDWRYAGPFLTIDAAIAGDREVVVDDVDSPVWECPQLVRLETLDLLIVSVVDRAPNVRPAHIVAFTGRVVGQRFEVHHVERLGLGPDSYAPATVTAPDGRRLLFSWIPEDPPAPESLRSWAGCLTLPRVLSFDAHGRLQIALADEVGRSARPSIRLPDVVVPEGEPWTRRFQEAAFELRVSIIPDDAVSIRIDVGGRSGTAADIRFDPRTRRFSVSRTGRVTVAGRDPHGACVLPPTPDGAIRLRLVLDGSVLELSADDRVMATARLPEIGGGSRWITFTTFGGACRLVDVGVWTFPTA